MAFSQVVSILARRGICERASIDEVYLDLTEAAEKMLKETPPEKLETINEEAAKSHVLGIDKVGSDSDNNYYLAVQFSCSEASIPCTK